MKKSLQQFKKYQVKCETPQERYEVLRWVCDNGGRLTNDQIPLDWKKKGKYEHSTNCYVRESLARDRKGLFMVSRKSEKEFKTISFRTWKDEYFEYCKKDPSKISMWDVFKRVRDIQHKYSDLTMKRFCTKEYVKSREGEFVDVKISTDFDFVEVEFEFIEPIDLMDLSDLIKEMYAEFDAWGNLCDGDRNGNAYIKFNISVDY